MRALERCRRVLVRRFAFLVRGFGVGVAAPVVTLIVLIDCLKMMIGGSDVPGGGQMVMFA